MKTQLMLIATLGVAGSLGGGRALAAPPVPPGTESGFALFQKKCSLCHGNPAVERAPSLDAIRSMSPEKVRCSRVNGIMAAQGAALSDQERRAIAEFMSSRPLGSARAGAADSMPNRVRGESASDESGFRAAVEWLEPRRRESSLSGRRSSRDRRG